jgi:hypothetical protein
MIDVKHSCRENNMAENNVLKKCCVENRHHCGSTAACHCSAGK